MHYPRSYLEHRVQRNLEVRELFWQLIVRDRLEVRQQAAAHSLVRDNEQVVLPLKLNKQWFETLNHVFVRLASWIPIIVLVEAARLVHLDVRGQASGVCASKQQSIATADLRVEGVRVALTDIGHTGVDRGNRISNVNGFLQYGHRCEWMGVLPWGEGGEGGGADYREVVDGCK
jgi:hypothetical protein